MSCSFYTILSKSVEMPVLKEELVFDHDPASIGRWVEEMAEGGREGRKEILSGGMSRSSWLTFTSLDTSRAPTIQSEAMS